MSLNQGLDLQGEWLIVGSVIKPHGVHGDAIVEIITDFPERMGEGVTFGLGSSDGPEKLAEVHKVRLHKGRWLLSIKGIRDRESIDELRGKFLFLPEQSKQDLPDGYFYEHQLIGLKCCSESGEKLGEITGLDIGPGQTRLIVVLKNLEYLVPWVPEIGTKLDLNTGVLTIDPPPGLLGDEALIVQPE